MYTARYCNESINATSLKFKAIRVESIELIEALINRDIENIKEEISDVLYSTYCCIHTYTGISLPMIGAIPTIKKALNRRTKWEEIFQANDLIFNKKYLCNGSNYKKEAKVNKALELARKEQR